MISKNMFEHDKSATLILKRYNSFLWFLELFTINVFGFVSHMKQRGKQHEVGRSYISQKHQHKSQWVF